jgi:hypothetical protein
MSREHELFDELRTARRNLAGAKGAEKEARAVILDKKAARLRAESIVEEILSEVETGKTGRPVLDAIAANGRNRGAGKPPDDEEPESADERQRGPTHISDSHLVTITPETPAETRDKTLDGGFSESAENRRRASLKAAETVRRRKTERADRRELPAAAGLLPVVADRGTDLLPAITPAGAEIDFCALHGGPPEWGTPCKFEVRIPLVGGKTELVKVALTRSGFGSDSLEFLGKISTTGFRSMHVSTEKQLLPLLEWATVAARHLMRMEIEIDAAFPPSAPQWFHVPIESAEFGLAKTRVAALKRDGYRTWGDVEDERIAPLGGDSAVSQPAWEETLARLKARKAVYAFDGKPVANLGLLPVVADPAAAEPTADVVIDPMAKRSDGHFEWMTPDLDAALQAACYPVQFRGSKSPWPALEEHGCDDAKILEVLRAIWGAGYLFQVRSGPDKFGHTTAGGPVPKFWIGARKSKDAPPQLSGLQLADRVRTVLDLPRDRRVPEPTEADRQPVRKRRKAVTA